MPLWHVRFCQDKLNFKLSGSYPGNGFVLLIFKYLTVVLGLYSCVVLAMFFAGPRVCLLLLVKACGCWLIKRVPAFAVIRAALSG
jgi:hypothetical protein